MAMALNVGLEHEEALAASISSVWRDFVGSVSALNEQAEGNQKQTPGRSKGKEKITGLDLNNETRPITEMDPMFKTPTRQTILTDTALKLALGNLSEQANVLKSQQEPTYIGSTTESSDDWLMSIPSEDSSSSEEIVKESEDDDNPVLTLEGIIPKK